MLTLESASESEMIASSALLSLSSSSSATNYSSISSNSSSSSNYSSRFNHGIKKIFINSRNEEAANNSSSSFLSNSKSGSSSSLTTNNNEETSNFHVINNFKVVKKSRSKMYKICDIQNKNYKAAAEAFKETSKSQQSATSTVSSEPSVMSRRQSFTLTRKKMRMTSPAESPDNVIVTTPLLSTSELVIIPSAYITRRSEAILKLLYENSAASENEIRQVLGDNPTTSKALRMLLKGKAVKRSGAGGSKDPYVYMPHFPSYTLSSGLDAL